MTIVQDQSNPSVADVVALSTAPAAFLVTLTGDGTGNFTISSGGGDNAGIDVALETAFNDSSLVGITTIPKENGSMSNVALLDYPGETGEEVAVYQVHLAPDLSNGTITNDWLLFDSPSNGKSKIVAWGAYEPHPVTAASIPGSGPTQFGFLVMNPVVSYAIEIGGASIQSLELSRPAGSSMPLETIRNRSSWLGIS